MNELFQDRHTGISQKDLTIMLQAIGIKTLDELISQTIPGDILLKETLDLPEPMTEKQYLKHIRE